MESQELSSTQSLRKRRNEETKASLHSLQRRKRLLREFQQKLRARKLQQKEEQKREENLHHMELEDHIPEKPSPGEPDSIPLDFGMPTSGATMFPSSQSLKNLCRMQLEDHIPEEPSPGDPDSIRLDIEMPSGKWLRRRFLRSQSLKYLYSYICRQEGAPTNFEVFRDFPRQLLPCQATLDCPEPPCFDDLELHDTEEVIVFKLYNW